MMMYLQVEPGLVMDTCQIKIKQSCKKGHQVHMYVHMYYTDIMCCVNLWLLCKCVCDHARENWPCEYTDMF